MYTSASYIDQAFQGLQDMYSVLLCVGFCFCFFPQLWGHCYSTFILAVREQGKRILKSYTQLDNPSCMEICQ